MKNFLLTKKLRISKKTFFLTVCEYYAHVDCQDFVVSNCKECATYTPDNDRVGVCIKYQYMYMY